MLELRTTDEFAAWYATLDQAAAEDVAATLEVIVRLGTEKEAPGSSDLLTWYEHPDLPKRFASLGLQHPLGLQPTTLRVIEQWREFNGYVRRVVKHLESQPFVARLGKLDAEAATSVEGALARIKKASTRRLLAFMEQQKTIFRHTYQSASAKEEAALEAKLAPLYDREEIREAYLAALAAAGFEMVDLPAQTPSLREIGLRDPPPGVRLLYGIDAKRSRGLVVLGEHFDRSFYGDSVRRAERAWQEFLNGELQATQPSGAR